MLRVVLVHSGPVILPELRERLGAYAERKLTQRKVEIRLNTKVALLFWQDGAIKRRHRDSTRTHSFGPPELLPIRCWRRSLAQRSVVVYLSANSLELDVAGRLGFGGLLCDTRSADRRILSADGAAWASPRLELVPTTLSPPFEEQIRSTFRFSTFGQLAAIGRRTGVAKYWASIFRGSHVVALADHLSVQAPSIREETPRCF